jgi:restriction system protein
MAIPTYDMCMLPVLKLYADGKEHSQRETVSVLAIHFGLSETERRELRPSGPQTVFDHRISWARHYLKKAGLIESIKQGVSRITPRGLNTLKDNPAKLDRAYLRQFKEFTEVDSRGTDDEGNEGMVSDRTPEEVLESAFATIEDHLATELLQQIKSCSPVFFESLVVEVLVKMGYGGTRQDAGKAIGGQGDGGIDGIIKEDRLGLDAIYVQAKRWESTVGRPEIQKFVGALTGQRARKGVFITTSNFSREAEDYVTRIDSKVVLIGGETLAQLMIEHNVGVSVTNTYEVKKIDSDYFSEE